MPELYRKSSLERISNPDQLDKTIRITSPLSWLVLIGITLIIFITGVWSVYGTLPTAVKAPCQIVSPVSTNAVYSTETGTVIRLLKAEGDNVYKGESLMKVELPDRKERDIISDQDGIISEIAVHQGGMVTQNSEVVRVSPFTDAERVVVAYVPFSDIKKIANAGALGWKKTNNENQKNKPTWLRRFFASIIPHINDDGTDDVQITLTYANSQTYGHMAGYILNIDSQPTSTDSMGKVLGKNNNQATTFAKDNIPVAAVTIGLHTSNGEIWWSNKRGMTQEVAYGAQGTVRFIVKKEPPISKLFTKLKEVWNGGDSK